MDDEFLSCRNRNPLPQPSQARHRDRRKTGNLSRLSGLQGLHLSLRPDLDQRNGAPAGMSAIDFERQAHHWKFSSVWRPPEALEECRAMFAKAGVEWHL